MDASASQTSTASYEVAIVGFGPSGVSAANFLGHLGVSTFAMERDEAIYPRARAVTVNDWTLRAFQSVGLDAELESNMDFHRILRWKTYAGREILRLTPADSAFGHPASTNIYQPVMEETLRAGVERFDCVDVAFGEVFQSLEQDPDGVRVTMCNGATGVRRTIRAQYVLACDGGSSTVRSQLGIGLTGKTYEQVWVVIDAEVKRWWPDRHLLTFWTDAKRPVVDIPLALGHHRWEFPLRPGERKEHLESIESLWKLLLPMGVTPENVTIIQHAFYVHHVLTAEKWRAGRTFLVGDSAHMMPPWVGQGMQSGVRDAQNITWKLSEVLRGRLDDSVLDTYEAERAPQVQQMTELAERFGMLIGATSTRQVLLRNTLIPLLGKLGLARKIMSRGGAGPMITTGWLRGHSGNEAPAGIGRRVRRPSATKQRVSPVGRMIPQPEVWRVNGRSARLDDLLGDGFTLLGSDVDPRTLLEPAERSAWDALEAKFLTVRSPRSTPAAESDIVDAYGVLTAWFTAHQVTAVAVRPDRFVAASNRTGLAVPTGISAPAPPAHAVPDRPTDSTLTVGAS